MEKKLYFFIVLLCPYILFSQKVEVKGGIIADSIDVNSGLIKNVADPEDAQDVATKAYVDLIEARLALLTNAPVAVDDLIAFSINTFTTQNIDVLDLGSPDNDPDAAFRYGNFIEITNAGSTAGSSNNLSFKGRALAINNKGTLGDKADDYINYTPAAYEIDSFYYVITDLDGLKDTALVEVQIYPIVQFRLDNGETPKQIYDSDNSLLDSLYGKTYQGGLIAYLNTTAGSGLIAAPIDQSTGAIWGCSGTPISATSQSLGTGQANTTAIVNGCATAGIAARLCDDLDDWGYDNWFLPSKDELNKLYQNLKENGLGGFSSGTYWSSSEEFDPDAWLQVFSGGEQIIINKDFNGDVRAVRAF